MLDALRPLRDNKPLKQAPVAQLDRVSGYEPEGREFESLRARQLIKDLAAFSGFFCFWCAGICAYVSPFISRQARHRLRLGGDAMGVRRQVLRCQMRLTLRQSPVLIPNSRSNQAPPTHSMRARL